MEGHLFQVQRARREQQAHGEGEKHEREERRSRDYAVGKTERHEYVPRDLHERAQQFKDDHEWQREPARRAAARVADKGVVERKALSEAALPARTLTAQYAEGLWRFGPASGIGSPSKAIQAMQAHDELHVLADRFLAHAARFHYGAGTEHAKGARDDGDRVGRGPREPRKEERADVLERLEERQD